MTLTVALLPRANALDQRRPAAGFILAHGRKTTRAARVCPQPRSSQRSKGTDERERVKHSRNETQRKANPMTLFTVQLELGPETRAMIERVAANTVMHLELGPKTRETIKALLPTDSKKEGGEGLLRKGVEAARGR
jgi:hypothetical protein